MQRSAVLGLVFLALSIPPLIQTARANTFWHRGQEDYTEQPLVHLPLAFAGHTLRIEDSMIELTNSSGTAQLGTVQVFLDDTRLFPPSLAEVRPGISKSDFGRYHLWMDAWVFVDRNSRDSVLMFGQRTGAPDQAATGYNIVTIRSDGRTQVEPIAPSNRARSFPVYRTIQFLNDEAPSVYPFDLTQVWPNIVVPILYPVVTGLLGFTLVFANILKSLRRPRVNDAAA